MKEDYKMEENKNILNEEKEPSIFEMSNEELYDDDWNDEEKPKKKKKLKKNVVAIVVALLLLCVCSIGCIVYGVIQHNQLESFKTAAKENEEKVIKYESQIKDLTAAIALKDSELNKLKEENTAKQEEIKKQEEQKQEENLSMNFKVVSPKGLNIRVEPNANSDVKASLASGDTFIQVGLVITADDGSKWVELKWENGYGCIESANGDVYAERQ